MMCVACRLRLLAACSVFEVCGLLFIVVCWLLVCVCPVFVCGLVVGVCCLLMCLFRVC